MAGPRISRTASVPGTISNLLGVGRLRRGDEIRYRVSRRLEQAGEGLFWLIDEVSTSAAGFAAMA